MEALELTSAAGKDTPEDSARTLRRRVCKRDGCEALYVDLLPGERSAPAGYCSPECHARSKPPRDVPTRNAYPRNGTPKPARRAISPASSEQRAKIKRACIVTGDTTGCDPAHLWPRGMGGCDDPLCVVPLRRDVHEAYDRHQVDLLPHLLAHGMHAEIAHAVEHARGDLVAVLERLTGERWRPVASAA